MAGRKLGSKEAGMVLEQAESLHLIHKHMGWMVGDGERAWEWHVGF